MKPTLLVGTPTAGHPRWGYIDSRDACMAASRSFSKVDFTRQRGLTQQARIAITEVALSGSYDFLLMMDDDLEVDASTNPIDTFLAILQEREDVAAVGALYLQDKPFLPMARIYHPDYSTWASPIDGYEVAPEECYVGTGFRPEPMEFDMVATGFLMVRMTAIRDLLARNPGPSWRCSTYSHHPALNRPPFETTDDQDWCLRIKRLGWKVLADPRIRTTHWKEAGPLVFDLKEWESRTQFNVSPLQPGKNCVARKRADGLIWFDPLIPPLDADAIVRGERTPPNDGSRPRILVTGT